MSIHTVDGVDGLETIFTNHLSSCIVEAFVVSNRFKPSRMVQALDEQKGEKDTVVHHALPEYLHEVLPLA